MARTDDVSKLLNHLEALEYRALALAEARTHRVQAAQSSTLAAQTLRAAARRFPLLCLAGAFGAGVYVATRAGR